MSQAWLRCIRPQAPSVPSRCIAAAANRASTFASRCQPAQPSITRSFTASLQPRRDDPLQPSSYTSSVSASEVQHFTTLASSWWDPHGPSRLLHLMNPLRHTFIRECLSSDTDHGPFLDPGSRKKYTYLDIGCGGGIFASSAARLPNTESVTAVDPTPEVIAVAKENQRSDPLLSQERKLTYVNCAIEDLKARQAGAIQEQKDGEVKETQDSSQISSTSSPQLTPQPTQYDILTLFEVIEHLPHPSSFLTYALSTHLKPGGWLIGSTIARHPLSYITTKLIAEAPWPIGVVPRGTHDWNQYIDPAELKAWARDRNREAREKGEEDVYGEVVVKGCVYLPVLGWKWVGGSEDYGNYFFGIKKLR